MVFTSYVACVDICGLTGNLEQEFVIRFLNVDHCVRLCDSTAHTCFATLWMAILVCLLRVYLFGAYLSGASETFVYDGGCFNGTIVQRLDFCSVNSQLQGVGHNDLGG